MDKNAEQTIDALTFRLLALVQVAYGCSGEQAAAEAAKALVAIKSKEAELGIGIRIEA